VSSNFRRTPHGGAPGGPRAWGRNAQSRRGRSNRRWSLNPQSFGHCKWGAHQIPTDRIETLRAEPRLFFARSTICSMCRPYSPAEPMVYFNVEDYWGPNQGVRPVNRSETKAKAAAWCLLIHADASFSPVNRNVNLRHETQPTLFGRMSPYYLRIPSRGPRRKPGASKYTPTHLNLSDDVRPYTQAANAMGGYRAHEAFRAVINVLRNDLYCKHGPVSPDCFRIVYLYTLVSSSSASSASIQLWLTSCSSALVLFEVHVCQHVIRHLNTSPRSKTYVESRSLGAECPKIKLSNVGWSLNFIQQYIYFDRVVLTGPFFPGQAALGQGWVPRRPHGPRGQRLRRLQFAHQHLRRLQQGLTVIPITLNPEP
jgi:hypothetical protein